MSAKFIAMIKKINLYQKKQIFSLGIPQIKSVEQCMHILMFCGFCAITLCMEKSRKEKLKISKEDYKQIQELN